MAAVAEICSFHGGVATPTVVTDVRFKRADNDTVDALNPVPIRTTLDSYSWRKYFKVRWLVLPVTQIENVRFFVDPVVDTDLTEETGWDNVSLYAGTTGIYVQASVADEDGLVTALAGQAMKDVDLGREGDETPIDANTPLSVTPGFVLRTSMVNAPTFGETGIQGFVLMQMKVGKDAKPGIKTPRNMWYRWTEW